MHAIVAGLTLTAIATLRAPHRKLEPVQTYSPPLGQWVRLNDGRPILSPQGAAFESKAAFNPAVVKQGDRFVMLYRAQDSNGISRLGYATSTDGVHFTYAYGAPPRPTDKAVLVFTDGGMRETPPETYELFDLDARAGVRAG